MCVPLPSASPFLSPTPMLISPTSVPPQALEPVISKQIMELHHQKHHQTYVANLNKALASHAEAFAAGDLPRQLGLQSAIRFNGGGHVNHSLFWANLAPPRSAETRPAEAAPKLSAAIDGAFGSMDKFRDRMNESLLGIQGSGWGWLVRTQAGTGPLRIVTTKDQDVVAAEDVPIIGIDMWEHAYYLQVGGYC